MLQRRTEIRDRFVPMARALRHLTWILSLAALGCQTQSYRVGQTASIQFGTVRTVEQVPLQSDAAAGALIGGTIGLLATGHRGNAPRNAILGAAAGGIGTAAIQGNRTATAYTVDMLNGSTVRIISDQTEIRPGDCVAIETVGQTNNIRRESPSFCVRGNRQTLASAQRAAQAAASQCEAAKEDLWRAATPAEVDAATRRVNQLCN